MRNDLSLPPMLLPIPSIKQPSSNTDKRIVEIGLDETRAMAVDDRDGCGRGYGYVIRSDSQEFAYKSSRIVVG